MNFFFKRNFASKALYFEGHFNLAQAPPTDVDSPPVLQNLEHRLYDLETSEYDRLLHSFISLLTDK